MSEAPCRRYVDACACAKGYLCICCCGVPCFWCVIIRSVFVKTARSNSAMVATYCYICASKKVPAPLPFTFCACRPKHTATHTRLRLLNTQLPFYRVQRVYRSSEKPYRVGRRCVARADVLMRWGVLLMQPYNHTTVAHALYQPLLFTPLTHNAPTLIVHHTRL